MEKNKRRILPDSEMRFLGEDVRKMDHIFLTGTNSSKKRTLWESKREAGVPIENRGENSKNVRSISFFNVQFEPKKGKKTKKTLSYVIWKQANSHALTWQENSLGDSR